MIEQPLAPTDWLRRLQMGVARHEDVKLLLYPVKECCDEIIQVTVQEINFITQPKTNVGSDLIVAATPCVQLACHCANQLSQTPLVGCVNVLIAGLDGKTSFRPLHGNLVETIKNRLAFRFSEQATVYQGMGLRLTPDNVHTPETLIKGQRGVECFHQWIGFAGKAPAP